MPRNIPLIIEYVAFLGLICCLIIYNTNIVFLSIIIAFVALEIMMESFQVQLKQKLPIFIMLFFFECSHNKYN